MTQPELIKQLPPHMSIPDRVLLVSPAVMPELLGESVSECRVFLLVSAGRMTVRAGSNEIEVEAGSLVDMLVWEPVTVAGLSDDARVWCLLPNYVFTNESLIGVKPADSESFKDRHQVPVLRMTHDETQMLERQLEMLAATLADFSNFYRVELCHTYFRSFMLQAGNIVQRHSRSDEEPESVESRQDTILRSFLKLVWRYYRSEHNIDFYARRLCISSKHLSRVVRGKLGKTPYAVIRDELIQQASELLRTSKKSVQEISAELHFSEMASFCKFFKKQTGLSPTAYRNHRGVSEV